jgi:hypothetical protein
MEKSKKRRILRIRDEMTTIVSAKGIRFSFWRPGEKVRIAHLAGLSKSNLSDILGRRRQPRAKLAAKLEVASAVVLGNNRRIPAVEWRTNDISEHPAFLSFDEMAEKGITD